MGGKVIECSRKGTLSYFIAFLASFLLILPKALDSQGGAAWVQWCIALVPGMGALLYFALLARPLQLVLDPTGFTLRGGLVLWPKTVHWGDIDEIFIRRFSNGGQSVAYRYRPDAKNVPKMVNLNSGFGRALCTLGNGWSLRPDELIAELNAYKQRAGIHPPVEKDWLGPKALAEILVKHCDVYEGKWAIDVTFNVTGLNHVEAPNEAYPSALFSLRAVGIRRAPSGSGFPSSLVVDAAEVNPWRYSQWCPAYQGDEPKWIALKDLPEILVKYFSIHDGRWGIQILWGGKGVNHNLKADEIYPALVLMIKAVALRRETPGDPHGPCQIVNAAEVNPRR